MGLQSQLYDYVESAEGQKFLGEVMRSLISRTSHTWESIAEHSYKPKYGTADSDQSGSSKGQIKKEKASALFYWLSTNEPAWAIAIYKQASEFTGVDFDPEPEAATKQPPPDASAPPERPAPTPSRISWKGFLSDHGVFGQVDVKLINPRPNLSVPDDPIEPLPSALNGSAASIAPPDHNPLASTVIRLNEAFYFAFDPPLSGTILALQQAGHPWWEPLPLVSGDALATLMKPTAHLPHDHSDQPTPLLETERAGRHRFAFILAPPGLLPTREDVGDGWQLSTQTLNALADRLVSNEGQWNVLRLDVMFTA